MSLRVSRSRRCATKALAILLGHALLSEAATVHVSKAMGDNAQTCSAAQQAVTPKQTLQAGIACLAPGDTLVMHGQCRDGSGAYAELLVGSVDGSRAIPGAIARVQPGTASLPNGTATRPTTLQAAPGATPCLQSRAGLAYPGGGGLLTTFQGSQHLHITGLSYQGLPSQDGSSARGIVLGEAQHITIEHGVVAYGTVKAGVTSHHLTVRHMDLRATSPWCQWPAKTGGQPCPHNLYLCGSDHVIEQNRVDSAGHTGIQVSCEQGQVRNNVIRQNVITNAGAIGIGVGCRGCTITGNRVTGAVVAGLRITGSDNRVEGNTIDGSTPRRSRGTDPWGILWGSSGQVVNNVILRLPTARAYLGTQSGQPLDLGQVRENLCDAGGRGNMGCTGVATGAPPSDDPGSEAPAEPRPLPAPRNLRILRQ